MNRRFLRELIFEDLTIFIIMAFGDSVAWMSLNSTIRQFTRVSVIGGIHR
jgi:hypothetical protein